MSGVTTGLRSRLRDEGDISLPIVTEDCERHYGGQVVDHFEVRIAYDSFLTIMDMIESANDTKPFVLLIDSK